MELSAQLIGCGVAGLMPGISLAIAIRRALHHRRGSQVARFARDPGAAIREGSPLLHGTVVDEDRDDVAPGPVLLLDVAAEAPAWPREARTPPRSEARRFSLRLPSGAVVRVEPEDGRWTLDTIFVSSFVGGVMRYEATLHPGSEVYVAGQVQREIDPRATGKGYRDVGEAWIVRAPARGELAFSAAPVIEKHARRARFHAAWSIALAAITAGAVLQFLARGTVSDAAPLSSLALALMVGIFALAVYELSSELTEPWLERRTR